MYDDIIKIRYNEDGTLKGTAMEHRVWRILDKEKYTEDGIKKIEAIYDFINSMVKVNGVVAMKGLFDMWNDNADETFWILNALVHPVE